MSEMRVFGAGRRRARLRDEAPQAAHATIPRALRYLRPYRLSVAFIALCLIVNASLGVIPPLLIRELIDIALPEGRGGYLNLLVLGMVAVPVATGLVGIWQSYLNTSVSERIMFDLRNQLYTHLQGFSIRFFTATRTGEIMSRLTADVAGIQSIVTGSMISIASNFFTVATTLVVIFAMDAQLALISVCLLPLFIVPTRFVGRMRRDLQEETQQARADLNSHMQETLNVSGFLLMKVFHREYSEARDFLEKSLNVMSLQIRSSLLGRWFFFVLGLFSMIGPAIIYWWGGHEAIGGTLTIGTIVAFVAYLQRLYGPVRSLASVYVDVQAAIVLFERIFEYLDIESEVMDAPGAHPLVDVRGRVGFDRVEFEYIPGRRVLHDVTFVIEPGEMVALVGPSGAGKSTISYLIPRLYDRTAGTITVDGHDIQAVTLDSLRENMGMVTQETFLFHASIADNLRYGRPEATDSELVAACRAAQLEEFVEALPKKYATTVGERGYRLSGGEKQRLAIARVLLKDPRILILDEATSNLDTLAEELIRAALERLLSNRTSLVIAHRLSTILRADKILVMNEGRLVESGTHQELLSESGLYARLYEESGDHQPDIIADTSVEEFVSR